MRADGAKGQQLDKVTIMSFSMPDHEFTGDGLQELRLFLFPQSNKLLGWSRLAFQLDQVPFPLVFSSYGVTNVLKVHTSTLVKAHPSLACLQQCQRHAG